MSVVLSATLSTLHSTRGPTRSVTSDATSAPEKQGKVVAPEDDAELPGVAWTEACGGACPLGERGVWCEEREGRRHDAVAAAAPLLQTL